VTSERQLPSNNKIYLKLEHFAIANGVKTW